MLVGVQLLQMCEQPLGLKQYCIIYQKRVQSISINVPQNYQTWHDVNRSFLFGLGLGLRQCNQNDLDFVCICNSNLQRQKV